mmetsp:Transcript_30997/g.46219  ORF Transcript_30997/g.46219 Transcript_30997/m.46219 type:complete len:318 (-) Transcript_30997:902-1855(-)
MRRGLHLNTLLTDESIKPRSINGVFFEFLGLKKLHKILNSGANFSTNFNFLQCKNKGFAGFLTGGALCEKMSKLRVSEFVNTSIGTNTEVTPNRGSGLELNAFNGTGSWLKSLIWVLSCNTCGDDVTINWLVVFLKEVNGVLSVDVFLSVQGTDLRNVGKRNTHDNLKLGCGKVTISDTLSNRVLYLQTGVQFKEEVFIGISVVKVLNSSCTNITDRLGKALCCPLHLTESILRDDSWGSLLENLLETTLGRTVTTVECNSVSMLITDNLNLNVTGILTKLHKENRRSNNLIGNLYIGVAEISFIVNKTDTLSSTSF